ncbi:MAG: hypothetical protein JEZ03_10900 [Bacteroidales bacterium]|nr:hypothetical protein [Bacteroidales bacterium]
MAEFLPTSGVSYNLEDIILKAKKVIYLVSPYLKLSKTLYERLLDADKRGVQIIVVYGKSDLKSEQKEQLYELEHIELYYFDNLHAKCYFNENKMVLTSMNIYEFSEKNNREMGILIDRNEDAKLYNDAAGESLSIVKNAKREKIFRQQVGTIVNEIPFYEYYKRQGITEALIPRMEKRYFNKTNLLSVLGFRDYENKKTGIWLEFGRNGNLTKISGISTLNGNTTEIIDFKRGKYNLYAVLFTIGNIISDQYGISIKNFFFESRLSDFIKDDPQLVFERIEKVLGYKFCRMNYITFQEMLDEYNSAMRGTLSL